MDYAWQVEQLIALALQEDLGSGDVATEALIASSQVATARWYAKATGVVSGLGVALRVFQTLDPAIEMQVRIAEGQSVTVGQEIVSFQGNFKALLIGERTALNFAQRMSGYWQPPNAIARYTKNCTRSSVARQTGGTRRRRYKPSHGALRSGND